MKTLLLSIAALTLAATVASAATAPPPRDAEDPAACSYPADFAFDDGGGVFGLAGLAGQYCSSDLIFVGPSERAASAVVTATADRRLQFGGSFLADVASGDSFGLIRRGERERFTKLDGDGRGYFDVFVRRGETFGFYYEVAAGSPGGTLAVDYFAEPPKAVPAPVPAPAALPLAIVGIGALAAAGRARRRRRAAA